MSVQSYGIIVKIKTLLKVTNIDQVYFKFTDWHRKKCQYDQGLPTTKHPSEIIQLQTSDHYNHGQSTFF